jgi:hypothetical protein
MAELKTKATNESVIEFIEKVENEQQRKDSYALIELFKEVTGREAVMWGPSIIGFGSYHYKYESGYEGDMALVGFSPRKNATSLYVFMQGSQSEFLLEKLGKFKMGKACIYIKKLSDVDTEIIKQLILRTINHTDKIFTITS